MQLLYLPYLFESLKRNLAYQPFFDADTSIQQNNCQRVFGAFWQQWLGFGFFPSIFLTFFPVCLLDSAIFNCWETAKLSCSFFSFVQGIKNRIHRYP